MLKRQCIRTAVLAGALTVVLSLPSASAADVDFSGTLINECTLALTTAGSLAMSSDGTTMSSQEAGGNAATIGVVSIGSNTLTINAPTVVSSPPAYDPSAESVSVAYTGASGLSALSQSMTDQTTSHSISSIPLSVLTINTQVVNSNSFAAGDYSVRTVVTCS